MNRKLFSIIVPVYNLENYIEDCIRSILEQNFDNYECILVDDGSTDKSLDICMYYQNKSIKVIHQNNSGVMAARMRGLSCADGDWVTFVDGDDRLAKDALACVNRKIREGIDIIIGRVANIDGNNNDLSIRKTTYRGVMTGVEYEREISLNNRSLHGFYYRTEILKKELILIPREITNNEDMLFNLFVSPRVRNVDFIENVLLRYLVRTNSVSHKKLSLSYWEMFLAFIKNNYSRYNVKQQNYINFSLSVVNRLVRSGEYDDIDFNNKCYEDIIKERPSFSYPFWLNMLIIYFHFPSRFMNRLMLFHPSLLIRFPHKSSWQK